MSSPTPSGTASAAPLTSHPAWLRELDATLPSAPQVVLTGNVHDLHLVPRFDGEQVSTGSTSVRGAVEEILTRAGFRTIVGLDVVDGVRPLFDADGRAEDLVGGRATGGRAPQSDGPPNGDPQAAADLLTACVLAVAGADHPAALIIEGAARLSPGGDISDPNLHRTMVVAESTLASAVARPVPGPHRAPLYRTIVWILDRPNDLPAWFVGRDRVRLISVPEPRLDDRLTTARTLVPSLPGASGLAEAEREAIAGRFADATAGLTLRAVREIGRVCIDQQIPAERVEDGVRLYRVGVPDNPWHGPALAEKIRSGAAVLGSQVLGQPHAVRKALDILIRSTSGLTGAQVRGRGSRPQGVLFFAGPTGVGKTELAKALAELVFGNRDRMTRFDMSEFASEHTEARLIGAPPGYTGHTAGGELTNAVRQRPFSLLLFDEIDKAHPRILDKFLQILEDGRLTDGNGSTVHFTESLLVFTSNLGVYDVGPNGTRVPVVERGAPYEEVEERVLGAVRRHFTEHIGRPELLNRIGDNIVVFDFISEDVARALVPIFLRNVAGRVREARGCEVTFDPQVVEAVTVAGLQRLDFGGRGVSAAVETMLVNPLARALFEAPGHGASVRVTAVRERSDGWAVDIA